MSAIAGAVGRFDGARAVSAMLDRMAHRAPHGRSAWTGGGVALGHGLLNSAPGGRSGGQPHVDGGFAIVADLRLDNRDELIASLGLGGDPSDAALALAAYRRWGDDAPGRLVGDFAFAIWDASRGRLFCARDHFGVKPFYYARVDGGFMFASEGKGLLAVLPSCAPNEAAVAEFVAGLNPESSSTYFDSVQKLPPAHHLVVGPDGIRETRYWRLEPGAEFQGDAAERFAELLERAVRRRSTGATPPAAMLSGGLDSSSICVLAAGVEPTPLRTFSMVFDKTPQWSERPYIEAVLRSGEFDPTFISADDHDPFADFQRILDEQEGPFVAPTLALSRSVPALARTLGVEVIMDGHGGDEVVSHGYGRLRELTSAGRWLELWREVSGVAALYGESPWPSYLGHLGSTPLGRPFARAYGRGMRRLHKDRPANRPRPILNNDLARRLNVSERWGPRMRAAPEAQATEQAAQLAFLRSSMVPYALETLDKVASAFSLEYRYPFYDKDLVEFSVSLPSKAKLRDGWTRRILRDAMDGRLPPQVQWRKDKLDFAPHMITGLLRRRETTLDPIIIADRSGVGAYVNLAEVRRAYERLLSQGMSTSGWDVQAVWRTAALGLWLDMLQGRPAAAGAAS